MNQGWFVGACTGIVLLFGCGKSQGKWESFPIEIYSDPGVVSTPQAQADLQEAMMFWEERAGKKLFDYRGNWTGGSPFKGTPGNIAGIIANVIFFQFPWPFAEDTAGQTTVFSVDGVIRSSVIMLNPDIPLCPGDCAGTVNQTSARNLITHELGHFIGMGHDGDPSSIMYPTVLTVSSLKEAKVNLGALRRAVGSAVMVAKSSSAVKVRSLSK